MFQVLQHRSAVQHTTGGNYNTFFFIPNLFPILLRSYPLEYWFQERIVSSENFPLHISSKIFWISCEDTVCIPNHSIKINRILEAIVCKYGHDFLSTFNTE